MNLSPLSVPNQVYTIVKQFAGAGPAHRQQIADIGIRISVSGVRGKSTAVQWLHDILNARDYDTYAKITGIVPTSMYNGSCFEIERSEQVRLYENERELRKFDSIDAAIVENQGIREYTTRLVNEQYIQPHIVFITNIRTDHLDTLGSNRLQIARSLARSVPAGTHVVSGEQNKMLADYLEAELSRRDATISHVEIPNKHRSIPGAEIVYGINPILQAADEPPINTEYMMSLLQSLQVSWTQLPSGRVFNAAAANDVQSTELIRRNIMSDTDSVVQPLIYLREDRRGRTVNYLRYLNMLFDAKIIAQARIIGQDTNLFKRHASFPVIVHNKDTESPQAVLEDTLADGWPVLLMGNQVPDFMQKLLAIINRKEQDHDDSSEADSLSEQPTNVNTIATPTDNTMTDSISPSVETNSNEQFVQIDANLAALVKQRQDSSLLAESVTEHLKRVVDGHEPTDGIGSTENTSIVPVDFGDNRPLIEAICGENKKYQSTDAFVEDALRARFGITNSHEEISITIEGTTAVLLRELASQRDTDPSVLLAKRAEESIRNDFSTLQSDD